MPGPVRLAVAFAFFVLVAGAITWKTAKHKHDPDNYITLDGGLLDFNRAVYAATDHFLEGGNPYGPDYNERDPAGQGYPLFSPSMLLVYAPLGALPYPAASWTFFAINLGLVLVLAWLILSVCRLPRGPDVILLGAALLLMTRPGYNNAYLGQQALVGTIGTILAVQFARSRPWLGAFGIFLTSLKPTFAISLFIFLLCRRDFRCAFRGLALSAAGAMAGTAIIAFNNGGIGAFVQTLLERYSGERPGVAPPGTHYMHIDLADNIAKFFSFPGLLYLVPAVLLTAGCVLLLRVKDEDDLHRSDGASGAIIFLLMLLSIYHAAYDLILLALPFAAIFFRTSPVWMGVCSKVRWTLLAILGIPLANHLVFKFETWFEVESLAWKLTTSINTVAMVLAFMIVAEILVRGTEGAKKAR